MTSPEADDDGAKSRPAPGCRGRSRRCRGRVKLSMPMLWPSASTSSGRGRPPACPSVVIRALMPMTVTAKPFSDADRRAGQRSPIERPRAAAGRATGQHDAENADDRADREVELAGDQQHRRGRRDDARHRRRVRMLRMLSVVEEVRRGEREEDEHATSTTSSAAVSGTWRRLPRRRLAARGRRLRPRSPRALRSPSLSLPAVRRRRRSVVISSPSARATTRPRAITYARSATWTASS